MFVVTGAEGLRQGQFRRADMRAQAAVDAEGKLVDEVVTLAMCLGQFEHVRGAE